MMRGRPIKRQDPSRQRPRLPPLTEAPLEVLGSALRPGGSPWLAKTTVSHLPTPLRSRPASPVIYMYSSKRDGYLPPIQVLVEAASVLLERPSQPSLPPAVSSWEEETRRPRGRRWQPSETPRRGRVQEASFQDPRGLFLRPLREQIPPLWQELGCRKRPGATPFEAM